MQLDDLPTTGCDFGKTVPVVWTESPGTSVLAIRSGKVEILGSAVLSVSSVMAMIGCCQSTVIGLGLDASSSENGNVSYESRTRSNVAQVGGLYFQSLLAASTEDENAGKDAAEVKATPSRRSICVGLHV